MSLKVAVVEDDIILNQNIYDAIKKEGFLVETTTDGIQAEALLLKNIYDCIVLDVNLPGRNGLDIAKNLRNQGVKTPILLLTAYDQLEDKIAGFHSGADDYLTKPFYMKELLLRIHSLINRGNHIRSQEDDRIIRWGDITIDQRNKKVSKRGLKIILTPREYQILLKLVLAGGELVSKKDLIHEIWGSSMDHNTNTIEVYVNFLRNKVDRPFKDDMIKTRVGYGYYLELKD